MTKPAIAFFDLHVNQYTQFSEHIDRLKNCLKVIDDVFKYAAHYEADTILFGGDMGDLPKYIYIAVIDSIMKRLSKWFAKYPNVTMYAISGNHDQNKKNFFDKPAKTLLSVFAVAFPGRFVLIDNDVVEVADDCYVAGIPYYEHKACFDRALDVQHEACLFPNDTKAKVTLLIHQTLEGIYNKIIKPDTSPADPRYAAFDLVMCGHIHNKQIITDKFIVGGNPLHRDLGDIGSEKGIWLIDLANPKDYQFISRKGRYPEFVKMEAAEITEEVKLVSFAVPKATHKDVVVEGSADTKLFHAGLTPTDLLTNFWKQTNGQDERLLKVGLSLLES